MDFGVKDIYVLLSSKSEGQGTISVKDKNIKHPPNFNMAILSKRTFGGNDISISKTNSFLNFLLLLYGKRIV